MFGRIFAKPMRPIFSLFLLFVFSYSFGQSGDLITFYEKSGKKETPRYKETLEFCRKMDASSPLISLQVMGKSARNRDIPFLVVDGQGMTDPVAIHRAGKALVLIQACIHPGESEGKDAGLMLIRDLVFGQKPSPLLNHLSILFIPIFNVDGHERFGPYNRINQNGPAEMGWRVTAENLNLNRDYLKADAPEMQAWLAFFNHWMPDFFIDTHTTDGADYQYQLTWSMNLYGDMDPELTRWSRDNFVEPMISQMESMGFPVFPYIEFRDWHNPKSGLESESSPPMLSQGYTSCRNRPGLLIETHMLKPYDQRVNATYHCLRISLGILEKEHDHLIDLITKADSLVISPNFRKNDFPLRFTLQQNDSIMVDFKGIAYDEVKSSLTGETWFRYGKEKTTFSLPYFSKSVPSKLIKLPEAYILPPEWKIVIDRMACHGILMDTLAMDTTIWVSTCIFRDPRWQPTPYEGHHRMTHILYQDTVIQCSYPAGSVIIPLGQNCARIIAHMLEPDGNGSFLSWGFFDPVFEQKEYAERYVIEPLAEKMLAEDPLLRENFEKKKKEDPSFAGDPYAILNWFYSKTPWWDQSKDHYPVGRIYDSCLIEKLVKTRAAKP